VYWRPASLAHPAAGLAHRLLREGPRVRPQGCLEQAAAVPGVNLIFFMMMGVQMQRPHSTTRGAVAGALLLSLTLVSAASVVAAPTQVKPGFNVFSAEQDVEIGRQSAVEAEKQLPLLNDRNTQSYVESVFSRLAAQAPGAKFPYQIRVVNARDINAFALPGGFIYVNRGVLTSARTEGEVAGVLAHEISHVALRHGTNNATKSYMTQAGLGVLGGILGRGQPNSTAQIINIIGGLGMNAVFLKYSRDAETQADVVGAQIMARAGYDPMEMANFFELLRQQSGSQGGAAPFFSDHPAPANRQARIQQEVKAIGATNVRRTAGNAEFTRAQANLRGMGTAPTMAEISRGGGRTSSSPSYPSGRTPQGRQTGNGNVRIEAPSTRYTDFRQRDDFFEMQIPSNWRAYEAQNGFGVTIAPEGGVVDNGNGQESIVYGVIVNHYDPFEGSSGRRNATIDQATTDLINQIRQGNSHLQVASRGRRETIDGQPGMSTTLSGTSPVTGEEERVTVVTRQMGDGHILYTLLIAPGRDYAAVSTAFNRMVQSLRVNDDAAHRSSNP
jgi:Zn-dependent protease with chaperone function